VQVIEALCTPHACAEQLLSPDQAFPSVRIDPNQRGRLMSAGSSPSNSTTVLVAGSSIFRVPPTSGGAGFQRSPLKTAPMDSNAPRTWKR
jgi:hypothetical protein